MNAPAALRKGWCPGALAPMRTGDGLLVRIRVSGRPLDLDRAEAIADCAARFGNGVIEVSSRANIQLRGVREASLPDLQRELRDLGLLDADAAHEAVRNIVASPIADIDASAIVDVAPIVIALEARLGSEPSLRRLPAKFGFLLDGGGALPLGDIDADIRFEAFCDERGPRFAVALAGGADAIGVCAPGDVPDAAAGLAAAFLRQARAGAARRMCEIAAHGAASVLRAAGLESKAPLSSPRRAATHQDFLGIRPLVLSAFRWSQPQPLSREPAGDFSLLPLAGEGGPAKSGRMRAASGSAVSQHAPNDFFFVGAAPALGRMTADDFRFLAQAARRCSADDIRVTPWRALIVAGLERRSAHDLGAALARRFIVDAADPRLSVVVCSGAPACAHAARAVQREALDFAAFVPTAGGVALHVSGCEKGCAHGRAAPFTLVARPSGYDLVIDGRAGDQPWRTALHARDIAPLLASLTGRPRR